MTDFMRFIWQLPQTVAGMIYYLYLLGRGMVVATEEYKGTKVCVKRAHGCVTLGYVIFLSANTSKDSLRHEYGHIRQSMMLGPLYLIIIGIPSILWAATHRYIAPNKSYYWFYTEHWANRLSEADFQ